MIGTSHRACSCPGWHIWNASHSHFVTIAIVLRDGGYQLLKVDARLVWISKVVENQKDRFFMGFEFTKLNPEIQEKIRNFIRDDP